MDDILTKFLADNAITIILALYIIRGIGDVLDDIPGDHWLQIGIRGTGIVLGKLSDVVAGAIDAIKPKRNGKPKE